MNIYKFLPLWGFRTLTQFSQEMKLALLVAPALKLLSVEAVLAVHNVKEAPPNPDEVPLPAVPNVPWKESFSAN